KIALAVQGAGLIRHGFEIQNFHACLFRVLGRAQAPGWAACATASAVMLTIRRAVPDGTIPCTGLDTPSSSGPTRSASVAADSKVSAILAVSSDGISRRVGEPLKSLV